MPANDQTAVTGAERPDFSCANPLVTKIGNFVDLSSKDAEVLERLCRNPRTFEAEQSIFQEGTSPGFACIVVSGMAYRYKMLHCGHRQILGYLIPGDICDLSFMVLGRADYSVSVAAKSIIVKLTVAKLAEIMSACPNVAWALNLAAHLDQVMLREWLLNVGQRKAHQKLGHFLCEIAERLQFLGAAHDDGSFDFPFSQSMLADTIGATPVHVNRILQWLRREGMITLRHRRLRVVDKQKLVAFANFDGEYLRSLHRRLS